MSIITEPEARTIPRSLLERLRGRLERETGAEVLFDHGTRMLYSTDASLYQIEPFGVVLPKSGDDLVAIVRIASEEGVAVLPRGAATSLSGQTIGPAVIIDNSKSLNRIGIVDRDRMTVRVEPGVVLESLNAHLKPLGLMFGPDVSTGDRATLGGMIGNNSAGARSLRYGKVVDHVVSLDVVLSDGTPARLGPVEPEELDGLRKRDDLLGSIYRTTTAIKLKYEDEIRRRFPKILRRVSGYNLDELIPGLPVRAEGWVDDPWKLNLARLIVGSEGTLAVVRSAELRVMPLPKATGLVVISFDTITAALDRLAEIVATGPVAVEMLDRMILDLTAANPLYAPKMTFVQGRPAAVLAAQYYADSQEELVSRAEDLIRRFEGREGVSYIHKTLSDAANDNFWKVRKAGFSLLMAMVGDAKPIAFVEDTAVAPEKGPAFYARFFEIVGRQGLEAACYGHADVGCLHIRPIINVKTEAGIEAVRTIAREVSDLVAEFGGAMSGEHGDGLARSLWNRKLFGPVVYQAFQELKQAFDPHNLLNPGKVVGSADLGSDLRIGPSYHPEVPQPTAFDFSSQGGFGGAIEMCSGVGACRKNSGGTMCPSYMVTKDEAHSTRGRANALRMVMTGELGEGGWSNETLHEALDLCLQCKACKSECPSNVDMAKLKAEVLHQKYKGKPIPFGSLLLANVATLNRLGSAFAPLANATLKNPAFKWLLEKVAGIERRRTLPTFDANHLRKWFKRHKPDPRAGTLGRVIFLDDCFTTYNTPNVGKASIEVLEAAGYQVELAGLGCCGRPAISKGLLDHGRKLAKQNVAQLIDEAKKGTPILGCEPSCLLTLVDEYQDFRLGDDAKTVAGVARMVDSFIADPTKVPSLDLEPLNETVLLHGHCQQKALVGTAGTVGALKRVPGLAVKELDSGCCGMAGSFGYELGHFDVSEALANRVLLPAVKANPEAKLIAPGFSCRSQVHGLAGIEAIHPMELLAARLRPASK